MKQKAPISVIVLTQDEEQNLPDLLQSVEEWVEDVFIVDSGSTDRTLEIAKTARAKVVEHPFESHCRQWQWALQNLPIQTEWVFGLDADQSVTRALKEELVARFDSGAGGVPAVEGLYVRRRQMFRGHWIRHGGYYPKYLLKLFRVDSVVFDDNDLIDHHFHVRGRVGKLEGDIIERNRKEDDIEFWVGKHMRYAPRLAEEELIRRETGSWPVPPRLFGNPDERTVWLKRLWYRLPLHVRPTLYFLYRYFLRFGFLDGKEGFVFHFMQAYWFRVLVDIHLDNLISLKKQ